MVQDLAGVACGLAPLAAAAGRRGDDADAQVLREATATLRQGIRDLRALLLEIHPPNLEAAGLRIALSDLLSPLEASAIATTLEVDEAVRHAESVARSRHSSPDGPATSDPADALVYRVAREAIHNAQTHAHPSAVSVSVRREADQTRLIVTDDGDGFAPEQRRRREHQGHLGLTLLEGIVAQADGTLEVCSAPRKGTTVTLELAPR